MCSFTKAVRSSGRLDAERLSTRHMPVDQVGRHVRCRRTHGGGSHDGQLYRFWGMGFTQVDDLEIMVGGARKDLHGWFRLRTQPNAAHLPFEVIEACSVAALQLPAKPQHVDGKLLRAGWSATLRHSFLRLKPPSVVASKLRVQVRQ